MKNLLKIFLISTVIFGCNQHDVKDAQIVGVCQKMIVQDTINVITINFLIAYKNIGKEEAQIFTNSLSDTKTGEKYKNEGMFLRLSNKEKAIGQFYPSNNFKLKPNEELKILYTYKEPKFDASNLINSKESIFNQLKKIELYYKNNYEKREKVTNSNFQIIKSNFQITKDYSIIEFKKEINIEDALKLVGGKVNK